MVRDSVLPQHTDCNAAQGDRQARPTMRTPAMLHGFAATLLLAGVAGSSAAPSPAAPSQATVPSNAAVTASPSPWSAKCVETPRQEAQPPRSDLTIVAELGSAACGFDTTMLATWAGRPATLEFIDRDSALAHNFALYRKPERGLEGLVAATEYLLAPERETLSLPPLDPGTYYFFCDIHTRTMFGTLTAVEDAP